MKKWSTEITKIVKLYYENSIFLLSGYFNIRWLWDANRVPTWTDFGLKNPPKSALGGPLGPSCGRLGPSWAVLGRLGALLRRLEEASKNDTQKECTQRRQKSASWGILAASWAVLRILRPVRARSSELRVASSEQRGGPGEGTADARGPVFCFWKRHESESATSGLAGRLRVCVWTRRVHPR